jgi:hypothetical protein
MYLDLARYCSLSQYELLYDTVGYRMRGGAAGGRCVPSPAFSRFTPLWLHCAFTPQ